MRSGFLSDRIIHLHPTLQCNLACLHCYSKSDSKQKAAINLDSLRLVLPLLNAEGYNLISISGGEPLMYLPLLPLVDLAHESGFRVTMITNGLAAAKRLDEVAARLDGMAISFDGLATTHNHLRGRSDAFERASAALARLAGSGRPVGAAISLTRAAIPELPDLADHLIGFGAKALQVRPIALAGRAKTMSDTSFFGPVDQARLYLVILALRDELAGQVQVHCDLSPAQTLWQQRDAYAPLLATCAINGETGSADRLLADLVNPLVITESGTLKPIAYDFNPDFNVATLETLSRDHLLYYKQQKILDFKLLLGGALAQLKGNEGLVDWFDHCARFSEMRGQTSQSTLSWKNSAKI